MTGALQTARAAGGLLARSRSRAGPHHPSPTRPKPGYTEAGATHRILFHTTTLPPAAPLHLRGPIPPGLVGGPLDTTAAAAAAPHCTLCWAARSATRWAAETAASLTLGGSGSPASRRNGRALARSRGPASGCGRGWPKPKRRSLPSTIRLHPPAGPVRTGQRARCPPARPIPARPALAFALALALRQPELSARPRSTTVDHPGPPARPPAITTRPSPPARPPAKCKAPPAARSTPDHLAAAATSHPTQPHLTDQQIPASASSIIRPQRALGLCTRQPLFLPTFCFLFRRPGLLSSPAFPPTSPTQQPVLAHRQHPASRTYWAPFPSNHPPPSPVSFLPGAAASFCRRPARISRRRRRQSVM